MSLRKFRLHVLPSIILKAHPPPVSWNLSIQDIAEVTKITNNLGVQPHVLLGIAQAATLTGSLTTQHASEA